MGLGKIHSMEKETKAKSLQDLLCGVCHLETQIYDRAL